MRRISYWLASGDNPGLARQDLVLVTADDATAAFPPDIPEDSYKLLADEVQSLQFQYFDGSTWQDSWDGTMPGSDGVTPIGPPLAIAVTIGVPAPGTSRSLISENNPLKMFRHVIPLVTANGTTPAPTTSSMSSP
jgi:hypothetical protein